MVISVVVPRPEEAPPSYSEALEMTNRLTSSQESESQVARAMSTNFSVITTQPGRGATRSFISRPNSANNSNLESILMTHNALYFLSNYTGIFTDTGELLMVLNKSGHIYTLSDVHGNPLLTCKGLTEFMPQIFMVLDNKRACVLGSIWLYSDCRFTILASAGNAERGRAGKNYAQYLSSRKEFVLTFASSVDINLKILMLAGAFFMYQNFTVRSECTFFTCLACRCWRCCCQGPTTAWKCTLLCLGWGALWVFCLGLLFAILAVAGVWDGADQGLNHTLVETNKNLSVLRDLEHFLGPNADGIAR